MAPELPPIEMLRKCLARGRFSRREGKGDHRRGEGTDLYRADEDHRLKCDRRRCGVVTVPASRQLIYSGGEDQSANYRSSHEGGMPAHLSDASRPVEKDNADDH